MRCPFLAAACWRDRVRYNAMSAATRTVAMAAVVMAAGFFTAENPRAQPGGAASPAFEAASIKPSGSILASGPVSPNRFVERNAPLWILLANAYDVNAFEIQGGDPWTRTSRFDVDAIAEGRPTAEQMRLMVRRLLAERFGVKVHSETRELARYALVRARGDGRLGDKLRRSAIDCRTIAPSQPGGRQGCSRMHLMRAGSQTLRMRGYPISELARLLQAEVRRTIVDKTGLTGTYDVDLETERPAPGLTPPDQPATPREALSLFTALEEQLGLKLQSERGPVEVLVLDHAEPPTPD